MSWTEKALFEIETIYNKTLQLPFIEELQNGTLPMEKFQFYMGQDSFYLEHFARSLALIAARAQSTDDTLDFIHFAEGAIVVEKALHDSYFQQYGLIDRGNIEPTTHHYICFLKSTAALEQVEIAMAAVLPCFWIYKKVGDHIYKNQSADKNPYQKWIDTYSGDEFGLLVEKAKHMCNTVAEKLTKTQQQAMTRAFLTASKLEYMFWRSAYNSETWKV